MRASSKRSSLRHAQAVAAAVSLVVLSACGGGDGGSGSGGGGAGGGPGNPEAGGSEVPPSASASATGAFTFVASVAALSSDTGEPLRVGDAVLATSETEEPSAL